MNTLFLHIGYLVLRHECVVVPGFGAFICRHLPVSFDMENGVIHPASTVVTFNHAVKLDDGLMVNSYVRKYGMTIQEAKLAIAKAVSLIQQRLASERNVALGNIGTMSLDEESHIIFHPASTPMPHCGFEAAPLLSCIPDKNNEESSTTDFSEDEATEYYNFRISKQFTRIAATLFAVLAVCISVILNPIPTDNREQRASVLPLERLLSHNPDDSGNSSETSSISEELSPENSVEETSAIHIEENDPSHYLIIGTFSTEKEAVRFLENFECKEFELQIVPSKRVFRVAAVASDSRENLQKVLNTREFRTRFPNSWIWSKK